MNRLPHPRSSPVVRRVLLASGVVTLAACADSTPLQPRVGPPALDAAAAPTAEQSALNALTRAVAMALANPGMRAQLKNDLRASRHTVEHKLELRSHLKGRSGGLLLAQMAQATGIGRDSLTALVNAVRPLEFYMPVDAHRESWSGGDNLLVASQLAERNVPTAYDLSGNPVSVSLDEAPATPTLTLVPVETDFASELAEPRYRNAHDGGGSTIGTYILEDPCLDPTAPGCTGGTNPPPGTLPDAVYLTESHLLDAHEPWTKGDPEVELHVHGPQSKDYPRYGEDLTCSGADVGGDRYFDQNGNNWAKPIGGGAPLLMDRYNVDQFQARFPKEAVHYIMWEDDYQACKTVTDRDMKATILASVGTAIGAGITVQKATGSTPGGIVVSVATIAVAFAVDIIKNGASLLYGNDDLIGVLVDIRGTADTLKYPGQTHRVMTGSTYNGTARLESVWPTEANGRSFAASVTPSTTTVAIDQTQTQSLTATVRDQYGVAISGHPIAWRSDNPYVAKIDDDGIVRPSTAGSTTVYVRACDPNCLDRAVNVAITGPSISGPSYAYDAYASLSATVVNPRQSSYHFSWEYSTCEYQNCSGYWYSAGAGQSLTSSSVYVSRYANYVNVRVTVRTAAGGSVVGTAYATINGAGEVPTESCADPTQLICTPNAMSIGVRPAGSLSAVLQTSTPEVLRARAPKR